MPRPTRKPNKLATKQVIKSKLGAAKKPKSPTKRKPITRTKAYT